MNRKNLLLIYKEAKNIIKKHGYSYEISWQRKRSINNLYEPELLQEIAWVILSAGMKESVIRSKFDEISTVFFYWSSAKIICRNKKNCYKNALSIFNHDKKISSIISVAELVYKQGFDNIIKNVKKEGLDYLQTFPFIGPITKFHLAKNIGLNVVKPDRHLVRMAKATNFESAHELCNEISKYTNDNLNVIDLVLWRFATCEKYYLNYFK